MRDCTWLGWQTRVLRGNMCLPGFQPPGDSVLVKIPVLLTLYLYTVSVYQFIYICLYFLPYPLVSLPFYALPVWFFPKAAAEWCVELSWGRWAPGLWTEVPALHPPRAVWFNQTQPRVFVWCLILYKLKKKNEECLVLNVDAWSFKRKSYLRAYDQRPLVLIYCCCFY